MYSFVKFPSFVDNKKDERRKRQLKILVSHFLKARAKGDFGRLKVIGFQINPLVELLGLNISELCELFSST